MTKPLIFICCLFIVSIISAQCPNRAITLSRQVDVDNFKQTFPNCSEISTEGLFLNSIFIKNLDSLDVLIKVNGIFSIMGLDSLTNIKGLKNISYIGRLSISNNPRLVSLAGLDSLTSAYSIEIVRNNILKDLKGLNNLKNTALFYIQRNSQLISFDGLNSLDSVGSLSIEANENVKDFSGMTALRVCQDLSLYDTKIPSFEGLRKMKTLLRGALFILC